MNAMQFAYEHLCNAAMPDTHTSNDNLGPWFKLWDGVRRDHGQTGILKALDLYYELREEALLA